MKMHLLSEEDKHQLDGFVRSMFQGALEKYALPNLLEMPEFQNFAREVANGLYDSLDGASLPETVQQFKNNNNNKQDYRSVGRKPHAVGKEDALQEGLDNVPKLANASPEDLRPQSAPTSPAATQNTQEPTNTGLQPGEHVDPNTPTPTQASPSSSVPLAEPLNVGAGSQKTPTTLSNAGAQLASKLSQPALQQNNSVDQTIEQHTPQRGKLMQGFNALRYRKPLKKIQRNIQVIDRKLKKLKKFLTNLERQAKPLRAIAFSLKRALNTIFIIMVILYIIAILLTCTIIGAKIGIPLFGIVTTYGSRVRSPLKLYLKRVEDKLKPLEKRIAGTKKAVAILQTQLQKLAQEDRKLRNASLLGAQQEESGGTLGDQSPASA